jgi:membrane protease YdiL (CAAX protease family)
MQYLDYIIIPVLFALPLLPFLKKQDIFKAFNYRKLVWALNRAGLLYLLLCIGFAFLFAWLENSYTLTQNGSTVMDITAKISLGFMIVTLFAFAPLLLILNIIKWCLKKEPAPPTE